MNREWLRRQVQLKYRLGELTVFSATFDALVCGKHFTELQAGQPALPLDASEDQSFQLCITRSQPLTNTLTRITLRDGWIQYVPQTYKRYYVDLRGTFDAYLKRFSSKTRSTLTRKVRKFAEGSGGKVDFREYRTAEDLQAFFAMAREISKKTYQERLLDSGLPDSAEFRMAAGAAAARGQVRAYLLFLSGKAVAFVYCPTIDGLLTYEYVGYDPDHQQLSPGTVLQYLILKRLFEEGGYRMFDFTEGEGAHKALFATDHVQCADVYLYRYNIANAAAVSLHLAMTLISDGIANILDRLRLKTMVKGMLRKAA